MKLIPFDYNVWSINCESTKCFCDGSPVCFLKQYDLPDNVWWEMK